MAVPVGISFQALGRTFTKYVFEKAGDQIDMHDHDFMHLSLVLVGKITAFGDGGKSVQADGASQPIEFPAGVRHAIRAEEDGTIILQIS